MAMAPSLSALPSDPYQMGFKEEGEGKQYASMPEHEEQHQVEDLPKQQTESFNSNRRELPPIDVVDEKISSSIYPSSAKSAPKNHDPLQRHDTKSDKTDPMRAQQQPNHQTTTPGGGLQSSETI
mmetsp:Transcript_36984/g.56662  ORF Transcript_36984/g.56662 Transcript_36984/m.56662 type:complete len:124 (+) Transcript_36984:466-837(+)